MAEQSELLLRHILDSSYSNEDMESTSDSSLDKANFIKVQTAYRACMNEDVIKSAGVRPLLKVLRKVEELFHAERPLAEREIGRRVSSHWNEDSTPKLDDQLSAVVLYLTKIGLGPLVDIYVGVSTRPLFSPFYEVTTA